MMKSKVLILVLALIIAGYGAFKLFGERLVRKQSKINLSELGLSFPDGFKFEVISEHVPGARVMALGGDGNIWVSQTSEGKISKIIQGSPARVEEVMTGLKNPHGIAFDPSDAKILYYAEEIAISRVNIDNPATRTKIADLPPGGRHVTRTIGFGPSDKLYVSIGSTCNVCHEENEYHGKIFSLNKDGSNMEEEARGLRNAVFFNWSDLDGKMWATEMGRDGLGDELPPDEVNVIETGKNYGWPTCFGNNVHDNEFDKNTYIRNPCDEQFGEVPAKVDLPAHSAPLGIDFIPEEGWPEEYWYDAIVALHGSWDRSEPRGYKLIRIDLDDKGNYLGTYDFISGWLKDGKINGRPVDILIQPGGTMYISDDHAGAVYKIGLIDQPY
ncbi:MAG: PQQ-dependent sugar dehydrogenase [Candidatus Doudnabacteria bacterium]|nr:PQQ-dependent sugar dehydrogenase [Candidatus Doudnabacteria bacterium]